MKLFPFLFFTLIVFISACHQNADLYIPTPLANIQPAPVPISRYDSALFSIDPGNLKEGLSRIAGSYFFFLGPHWDDTINLINLKQFVSDPNIRKLYNIEKQKYADLSSLQTELGEALARYRSHIPGKPVPKVYAYISGLNVEMPVLFTDSAMAVGLDLFLGNDQMIYREGGIPEYKIARMTRANLLPECMKAVAGSLVDDNNDDETLLNRMITAGKVLYFLDAVLPGVSDNLKIGYTPEQLAWCKANEGNIWKFLIGNQLLFNTEPAAASKLLADGPFTSGFAQESPGRIGAWVGWQIVRAYASNNRKLSLEQIMGAHGAQKILEDSGYKPAR